MKEIAFDTAYKKTQINAVNALVEWKKGKRQCFPQKEVKEHFSLFQEGIAEEHLTIAVRLIAIKCLSKLTGSEVAEIESALLSTIIPKA